MALPTTRVLFEADDCREHVHFTGDQQASGGENPGGNEEGSRGGGRVCSLTESCKGQGASSGCVDYTETRLPDAELWMTEVLF